MDIFKVTAVKVKAEDARTSIESCSLKVSNNEQKTFNQFETKEIPCQ